jgi:hypothetical protein
MEVDLFQAFTVVAFLMSVASFYFSRKEGTTAQVKELENRLTSLELKIDPIWEAIRREIPRLLLGNPGFGENSDLVQKAMREENMTDIEITRLMDYLNIEYQKAIEKDDKGRAVGLALFRATIRVVK